MRWLGNKYDDRTNYTINTSFVHPETGKHENVEVYVSYRMLGRALKEYLRDYYNINIETNQDVDEEENVAFFFEKIGFDLDKFFDDRSFRDCLDWEYEDSNEMEVDFEAWKDHFEYDNNLGKYKED